MIRNSISSIAAVTFATLVLAGPAAHANDRDDPNYDDEDAVYFSDAAQAIVDAEPCAKPAAYQAVSAAINAIMDMGVDLPDEVEIETIDVVGTDRAPSFRVVLNGNFAYTVTTDAACKMTAITTLSTAPNSFQLGSAPLRDLAQVAGTVLGAEFFGYDNIGGAYAFGTTDHGNDLDATGLITSYYAEWRGLTGHAVQAPAKDRATVVALLAAMNVKAFDDQPETAAKAAEIADLVMAALAKTPRLKLVSGSWSDVGIGDPQAQFLALVDLSYGETLLIEQGYAD